MARAYICLARNDLEDNLLQALDLVPNTSLLNPIYSGPGQTGYLSFYVQNDAVAITAGPPVVANATYYGLRAYLFDNIDNQSGGGHIPITVVAANLIAADILARVAQGLSLTEAVVDGIVDTHLNNSDLTGNTAAGSTSLGSIEELLRILSGEVYRVSSGAAFSTGGGTFHAAKTGAFVTAPDIIQSLGLGQDNNSAMYGLPVIPRTAVTQTGTSDVNFRSIRRIENTGELAMSLAGGSLSKLATDDFTFENPSNVYAPLTDTITCGSLAAGTGDVIYINGVDFTAVAGVPDPALQQFADITQGAATPTAVALSLRAAINHADSQALTGMSSPVANSGAVITVSQDTGNQYWFGTNASARVTFGTYPTGAAQAAQGARLVSASARAITVYDASGNVL